MITASRALRPMAFVGFCTKVLRLHLTAGQRVLCAVAFDGVQPAQLDGADREIARQLFGDVDGVPPMARRVLVLVLGRGSGKTTIAAAYGIWRMCTADLSRCGPGDVPHVVVVAPGKRTAGLAVRMALALVQGSPELHSRLESEAADGFSLRRSDGRVVAFAAFAASRGGASARGLSVLSFILDESQFFLSDSEFVVTDRDIFSALVPRLMPGGAGVFISTPWPVPTLMGELHEKNFGSPSTALAALAPTLVMRDGDEQIAAIIASERERDPENAAREFECDTSMTAGASTLFDVAAIKAALDPSLVLGRNPEPGMRVSCAADFAFRSDSSALVIVHSGDTGIAVADILERRPRPGAPLKPSEVVRDFAQPVKRNGGRFVIADGHAAEAIREHLQANGLSLVPAPEGNSGKVETHLRAKALLHEGRVRIPADPLGQRLAAQLRNIICKPAPGGGLTITAPRRRGEGHGDIASSFVLAVHATWGPVIRAADPRTDAQREQDSCMASIKRRYGKGTKEDPWWKRLHM